MSLIKTGDMPITVDYIKMLIYGPPGIGKSTLAITTTKPLLLDFDSGLRRVKPEHRKHIDFVEIKKWEEAIEVVGMDLSMYDSIVCDTVGKLLESLIDFIIRENPKMGNNGSLTLQGYGVLSTKFGDFCRQLNTKGKHVIFVAHDREEKQGDETKVRPDVIGGSLKMLLRDMDMIGYVDSFNKERVLNFTMNDKYYTKNTCQLEANIKIEDRNKVLVADMNWSMLKIINLYLERQNELEAIRPQYNSLLDQIIVLCDSVIDVYTAEAASKAIAALPIIWDSAVQAKSMFRSKIATLNIQYDRATAKYVIKTIDTPASQPPGNAVQEKLPLDAANPAQGDSKAADPGPNGQEAAQAEKAPEKATVKSSSKSTTKNASTKPGATKPAAATATTANSTTAN